MWACLFGALVIGWVGTATGKEVGWEAEEHRLLADSALAAVLREIGDATDGTYTFFSDAGFSLSLQTNVWRGQTFGRLCATFSEEDASYARFQERGLTVLQQLEPLSASLLEAEWQARSAARASPVRSAHQADQNAIVNYLLHHLIALQFARRAGQEGPEGQGALFRALAYEAIAQGYLGDAFSAGHLLVPRADRFAGLHPINNREAHHFYGTAGVYVMNSRGEVWQTFGDKLLHWYAPAYRHVLEAGLTSLRELFLIYFIYAGEGSIPDRLRQWADAVAGGLSLKEMVDRWLSWQAGTAYYAAMRLPALLLIPMPVLATWSIRTADRDEHGYHRRKHFPQLKEDGFHDPDFRGIDPEILYAKSAVPDWLVLDLLPSQRPRDLIRDHPDVASVRYLQERHRPPSYKGLLLQVGGKGLLGRYGAEPGASFGLGYGLWDDLLLVKHVSLHVGLVHFFEETQRTLWTATFGLGLPLGTVLPAAETIQFEGGYAFGSPASSGRHGFTCSIGLDLRTIPLGFTYAGVIVRLRYEWIWLKQPVHGPALQLVLH